MRHPAPSPALSPHLALVLALAALLSTGASLPAAAQQKTPAQQGAPAATPKPAAPAATASPAGGAPAGGAQVPDDVEEAWGKGVEAVIERAYRECFRTFVLGGRVVTLRLPFAESGERSELAGKDLSVSGGGKASPAELWDDITRILASKDFAAYAAALGDGREKLVTFDLAAPSWSADTDRFAIERMLSGLYPGQPHRPVAHSTGAGMTDADIYNYLYCVGRVGIDCSGFVWHNLRAIGKADGLDLDRLVGRDVGLPKGAKAALYVGTPYLDPKAGKTRLVPDRISALLPGDIMLFRGEDGTFIHSCIIQSVDLAAGRIRYLQSTDECPQSERGVHESLILFDPANPDASIKDPSLRWLQRRGVAFIGEEPSAFTDDGSRFRAYPELGGGAVVRLKALERSVARLRSKR